MKNYVLSLILLLVFQYFLVTECNPDAKRLYDDLLSTYNRLIRPVSNNTETVLVKLGLRLSQLIDLEHQEDMMDSDHSDSDIDSVDQLEEFRKANVRPGMFVSGWEDPNDEILEDKEPHSTLERKVLWATNEGKFDVVQTILKSKSDCVNAKDEDGYTPLHRACYNNNIELAKLLIQYGADVNAQTDFKWTPLHSSCQWTNNESVAMLLQYGADVNARTDGDQTPLHIAASVSKCREMAMTVMLNPNVEPHLTNNSNETAADIARRSGLTFPIFEMAHSAFANNNLKDQILTTNVWLEHEWQDYKLKWDPSEYGGVTELYVPSEHIWLPDIVLYNNADGEYVVTTLTKAVLHHTGKVVWVPPAIFKSSCEIDVRYFPFDQQTCFMKFGSWTYDGDQIDLKHINQKKDDDNKVELGIDLREFYPSVEWDILGVPAERHEKYYPCCAEPYPDIFFNITLRRKTLFYTVNLIIPCVGISYLSVLVFYLPADSGEKIALCISILLSQTMFFLLISEIIPSTSLALPLLGKYLLFTMVLVGLSVVVTIIILNIHYRKPSTHKMAPWIRRFFIKTLPTLLLMRVPKDLLRDLAAKKINYGNKVKKSKFGAALAAEMQINSGGSSPDSIRRMQGRGGCNGLHSTTATNRFSGFMGALGGGLGNLGGYNGLPSVMSGLNESLSDVAPRKKYPFELEKAIHNVMFIQHHILRQDEFNAEDQDWGFVAMVLDRLFLWLFMSASVLGTFVILAEAPALYDDTKPIDVELSVIAQQIYNLTLSKHKT